MQRFEVGRQVVDALRVQKAGDDVGGVKVACVHVCACVCVCVVWV